MVIWVCEASEVNNLTVLAVGPNGHNNNNKDDDNKDKIAYSRSDPPMGSDKKSGCRSPTLDVNEIAYGILLDPF